MASLWLLAPALILLPWPFVFGAAVVVGLLAWHRDRRRLALALVGFGVSGALLLVTPILGTVSMRLISWTPSPDTAPALRAALLVGGMALVALGGVSLLAAPALLLRAMALARSLPDPLPPGDEP